MVDLKAEFQSGHYSIYGQWGGILSAVLLLIFGILNLFYIVLFGIIAIAISPVLLLMEIPIFVKIIPGGPKIQTYIDFFENHYFRAALYFGFSLVMFLSTLQAATALILPAITLLGSCGCYIMAGVKNQERVTSAITGGTGFVEGAQNLA